MAATKTAPKSCPSCGRPATAASAVNVPKRPKGELRSTPQNEAVTMDAEPMETCPCGYVHTRPAKAAGAEK